MLGGRNPLGFNIPYLLLTNGGGIGEQERCNKLTQQLGVQIQPSQYLQAHTILTEEFARKYADRPVLVLGGKLDKVRQVAENYGFKKAYTTLDVMAWNPSVWPLHQLTPAELASARRDIDFSQTPISAVFVFHDPRNWGLDVQIICDVLRSGGIIGGSSDVQHQQAPVELVFCNPDLIWRSEFPRPRLGQGAFREAFQAVYKATTGSRVEYPCIQYGKPTKETSSFTEQVLARYLKDIYGADGEFPHVYMIGDNPESDIAGANIAGWSSILVHTGVYDPRQGPPTHTPTHEAEDVEEAVRWALDRELRDSNTSP
ncbi:HAD-like domain-containing protein [Infundibulicybe gibba]|nr:HAD-like domain-containing protein [Infundibulicybe gibba]